MLKNRYVFIWQDKFLEYLTQSERTMLKYHKAKKGEVVYANKIKFIILTSGSAHLKYYSENNEYILCVVRADNFIVLDELTALEMLEKSEFFELNFKDLIELCKNDKFIASVTNGLVRNLLSQRDTIYDYTFLSIEERISKFLFQAYECKKTKDNIVKVCDITTMSQLLGASRQNVSKVINAYIKNGMLKKIDRNTYDISKLPKPHK